MKKLKTPYQSIKLIATVLFSIGIQFIGVSQTEELRIKGAVYFKVSSNSIATVSGSGVAINNEAGTIKLEDNATLVSDGDVNNMASGNLQVNGTLQAKSDWNNDGTASTALVGGNTGVIEFAGSANQNIGGTTTTTFENFTINNANGVTLLSNQTIADTLTFTDGIITTGAFRLDATSTSNDMVGYGDGKYIFGNFRRYVGLSEDYYLPIGNSTFFELESVTIASQTGLSYIDVSFTVSNENPVPGGLTVNGVTIDEFLDYGYWTFTPNAGVTSVSYTASIQSKGHTDKAFSADNYALITDYGSGGGWQNLGIHSNATQVYSATTVKAARSNLTTFGKYVVAWTDELLYNPPAITEELRVKGNIFKVGASSTTTISGSGVETNISNSGTLKILNTGRYIAEGNVNNLSSSSIQVDGWLEARGDWTNNATASLALAGGTIGTVEFNNTTGSQTIGGSTAPIFEQFEIDNSNGLTLSSDMSVSGQLTFTDGVITTGANTVIHSSTTAADLSVFSNTSFINGNLTRAIAAAPNTDTYSFPVGLGTATTDYHLLEFINAAIVGVTSVDVSVATKVEGVPVNDIDANIDNTKAKNIVDVLSDAIWTITPTGVRTAGSFGINLYVENVSGLSASEDNEFTVLKRATGSTTYADWDLFESTTTIPASGAAGRIYNAGSGYAQKTGFTSFSELALGKTNNIALPIELLSFDAKLMNKVVELNWETATEINNDYFIIEKSKQPAIEGTWEFVVKQEGAGNSSENINYFGVDKTPYDGVSYYRLKQVDFDGRYSYSNLQKVELKTGLENEKGTISIYPNPVTENSFVKIEGNNFFTPNENVLVVLQDVQGREIYKKIVVTQENGNFVTGMSIDKSLSPGIYLITGTSNNNIFKRKLIIK